MLDFTLANQPGYAFVENEISQTILDLLMLRQALPSLPILQTPVSVSNTAPVVLALTPATREAYQADRAAIEHAGFYLSKDNRFIPIYPGTPNELTLLRYEHPLYSFQYSIHCQTAKIGPITA